MPQPLIQSSAMLRQDEPFGGGVAGPAPAPVPATPAPVPVPSPTPGAALPTAKPPAGKDPRNDIIDNDHFSGPIGNDPPAAVPRPKPLITTPGGAGTAPQPPAVTPGGGTFAPAWSGGGGGGAINWRAAIADTDRNAVTRTVQDNELTSRQLERLIDTNGRYIQNARLRAREGASAGGMLMSTMAAGAAERAAIDAAAPIAQSDASVFANTASENMRAQNEDAMSDQLGSRSLLSQSESQQFQSGENAENRRFQSVEAAADRQFRSSEAATERDWRSMEAGRDRDQQFLIQERGFSFEDAQREIERGWRASQADIDRSFSADQNERARTEQRISTFTSMMREREAQLSQQLAAIFSNSALNPQQQADAARNARTIFESTTASFNASFAQGIPEIFMRPYAMDSRAPAPAVQPTTPALPPGTTPIPGTNLVRDANGTVRQLAGALGG